MEKESSSESYQQPQHRANKNHCAAENPPSSNNHHPHPPSHHQITPKEEPSAAANGVVRNHHHHHHNADPGRPIAWRVLPTPMGADPKKKIYRTNGVCQEFPKYNVAFVQDPRNPKKRIGNDVDLAVPKFTIDDNYCTIPPNREFSITGLNDNIDEQFLRSLCKKESEPFEVIVYYNPHTRKHLGIAFMDFDAREKSDAFIAKYNGRTMMGSAVCCFYDPMAYKISRIFEEITNTPAPVPRRYWDLKSSKMIYNVGKLLERLYANESERRSSNRGESQLSEEERTEPLEDGREQRLRNSAVGRSEEDEEKSPSKKTLSETRTILNGVPKRESPPSTATTSDEAKSSATPDSCLATATPSHLTESAAGNGVDLKFSGPFKDGGQVDAATFGGQLSAKRPKFSREFSGSDAHVRPAAVSSPKFAAKEEPCVWPRRAENEDRMNVSHRFDKERVKEEECSFVKQRNVANKSATHRWSSSSDSASSDHEEDCETRKKRKVNGWSTEKVSSRPSVSRVNGGNGCFTPNFSQRSPMSSNSLGRASTLASALRLKPAAAHLPPPGLVDPPPLSSLNSMAPTTQKSDTATTSTTETHQSGGGSAQFSPSKIRNLEQRLVQIFGKASQSGSPQSEQSPKSSLLQNAAATPTAHNTPSSSTTTSSSTAAPGVAPSIVAVAAAATAYYHQQPSSSSGTARQSFTPTVVSSQPSTSSSYRNRYNGQRNHQHYSSPHNRNHHVQPHFTCYIPPPPAEKTAAEREAEELARIDAEMKRERQEQMLKCYDVIRKARSTVELDLYIIMKKDLQRRMETDAFKALDEQWAQLVEQKKKSEIKSSFVSTPTTSQDQRPPYLASSQSLGDNSGLMRSLFPQLDDDGGAGTDDIFGMPYSVRISTMPSFKRKKPLFEVANKRKPSPLRTKVQKSITSKATTEKMHKKHSHHHHHHHHHRSPSVESDLSMIPKKRRKEERHRKSPDKPATKLKTIRPFSISTSVDVTEDEAEEKEDAEAEVMDTTHDEEEEERLVRESSSRLSSGSVNVSRAASTEAEDKPEEEEFAVDEEEEQEEEDEDAAETSQLSEAEEERREPLDGREKRLRNSAVGRSEEDEEKSPSKKTLSEKRAILNSLLRESIPSTASTSDEAKSSTTPDSCVAADTPSQQMDSAAAADLEATISAVARGKDNSGATFGVPASSKRPKFARELAALLSDAFVQPAAVSTVVSTKFVVEEESLPQPRVWPMRTEEEELSIRHRFEREGINEEDCAFLKLASMKLCSYFTKFSPDGRVVPWVQPVIPRAPRELPSKVSRDNCDFYYDDPELDGVVPHKTGCARTEGFYKVSRQRKRLLRQFDSDIARTFISSQDETVVRHKAQATKDERAMNRRLMTWMGDSNFVRVNQLKYRSKMIKFARSRIHGWGLYALETIAPEEMIIEYVGEKVRPTVADEREKNYERRGMGSSYMFRIDGDAVIDATKKGNYGRFINHSCLPNCTARVVMVDGDKRIVIYSKRLIDRGEEITYDYKFAREDEASKIECLCGAKCCHKYLN